MKKSLLSILILGVFWACQNPYTGLGTALDLEAPQVKITSHKNLDYVGGVFTLSGTVQDNIGVSAVTGKIKGQDLVFSAQLQDGLWTMEVSAGQSEDGAARVLSDGEYQLEVTASDAAGNSAASSIASITLVVDTKSPTAVVTSPALRPLTELQGFWPQGKRDFETLEYFNNGKITLRGASEENFKLDRLKIEILKGEVVLAEKALVNGEPLPQNVTGTIWNWTWTLDADSLLDQGQPLAYDLVHYLWVRVTIQDMNPGNPPTVFAPEDETKPGYFIIHPRADRPWSQSLSHQEGNALQAGVLLSGSAWDDDGLGAVYMKAQPRNAPGPAAGDWASWKDSLTETEVVKVVSSLSSQPRVYTWSLAAPSHPGEYTLFLMTQDKNGVLQEGYTTLNFRVVDEGAPITEVTAPKDLSIAPETGKNQLVLTGYSYDNVEVGSLKMAWIPQGATAEELLAGGLWTEASGVVPFVQTSSGIKIWDLASALGENTWDADLPYAGAGGRFKRSWTRNFSIESDFTVAGKVRYEDRKLLFQTRDGSGNITYKMMTLLGEKSSPQGLKVTFPTVDGDYLRAFGDVYDEIRGTVTDNSWIASVTVRWVEGDVERTLVPPEPSAVWNWSLSSQVFAGAKAAGETTVNFSGGNSLQIIATDVYGNKSYANRFFYVDSAIPVVNRLSSLEPAGYYGVGKVLNITVEFNKPVIVFPVSPDSLLLELNSGAVAKYESGSGTATLVFKYVVAPGDNAPLLNHNSREALKLGTGASLKDSANNHADLLLPLLEGQTALARSRNLIVDTAAPQISQATTPQATGFFGKGKGLVLEVKYNERVTVEGSPKITLNSGGAAVYSSGSGSDTLKFNYVVGEGDNASVLDWATETSLILPTSGDTILDMAGNLAQCTATGDLRAPLVAAGVTVDTTAPSAPGISGLTAGTSNQNQTFTLTGEAGALLEYSLNQGATWGTYSGETTISQAAGTMGTYNVQARQTDKAGNQSPASATLTLTLDKKIPDAPVVFGLVNGTFSTTRNFTIAGEEGAALEYTVSYNIGDETAAWGAGTWQSTAGSVALSSPGTYAIRARQRDAAGNIGPSGLQFNIVIDTTAPVVTGVSSPSENGAYSVNQVLTITVGFSKPVYVIGAPRLLLETGATDRYATYATGSGTSSLSFSYTVLSGDTSGDLDYATASALELNGGTLQDVLGNNSQVTLAVPGTAGSLGASKALLIDTTAPSAPSLSGVSAGVFNTNQSFTLTGLEAGAKVQYSLNNGVSWTDYTGAVPLNTDGTYSLTARQTDGAGNTSAQTAQIDVVVDKTAPAAPFVSGLIAGYFNTDQTFTILGENGAAIQYSYDGGTVWQNYSSALTLANNGTYTIRVRQTDAAGNPSPESASISVTINKTAPTITGVNSSTTDGHYRESGSITVTLTFSTAVYVTGAPRILLNSGSSAYANYASGTGTSTLNFTYFVSSGENSSDLDYASTGALGLNGGTIKDIVGNSAVTTLPVPGAAGSLGAAKSILVDTTPPLAPTFHNLSSGTFNTDRSFTITGEPGATLEYSTDNGLNWTTYSSTPGGVVTQAEGTLGNYVVVARQTDLAGNRGPHASGIPITLDKVAPVVTSVSAITPNGGQKAGTQIQIQVNFSKVVAVTGNPVLSLNTTPARNAVYSSGSGSSTLIFHYTVSSGDYAGRLDYGSSAALSLNTGTIMDTIGTGNPAALTLPNPGSTGSLGFNKDITIDAVAPTITTYSPAHNAVNVNANGTLTLTFSEPVFRESGNITIKRVTNSLPLVMTVDQYNEYLSALTVAGNSTNIANYKDAYQLRTNGVLAGGAPDPTAKYVLKFDKGYTDATLLPIFESLGYNTRTIPVDSTQVAGSGTNSITITPAGGLPIGIEYYVMVANTAFRDSVGNSFAGISNTTDYRFTTGPVATPVIRVNRISSNGYTSTTALTTTFRVDVDTAGASIVYSMPSTSTTTDSDSDYAGPTATAPATAYSASVTLGDFTYAKGWKYYIQAQATKIGLTASAVVGEQAYRTVLAATNPWFRGSNNSGGPTTAPGFPLRWEDNAVGYIRRGIQDGGSGNFYFISWEIRDYVYFKGLAGGAMTTVSNPAGYPAGTYEAGPSTYGWGSNENRNVYPGGYRFANHSSYEALADRRGASSTWIYRSLGE